MTLKDHVGGYGTVTAEQEVNTADNVANALCGVQSRNVLHRDVFSGGFAIAVCNSKARLCFAGAVHENGKTRRAERHLIVGRVALLFACK